MPKEKTKREIKVTKKNVHKFQIIEDRLVYLPTGEILDNVFTIYDYVNVCNEIEIADEVPQEFFYNAWLKNNKFTKLYQVVVREQNKKLSLNANGMLLIFMSNLNKSTNEVVINGKRPTNNMLMKISGVGIKLLNKILTELEEGGLIKRMGNTNNRIIIVNPEICFNGKNVVKRTVDAFKT